MNRVLINGLQQLGCSEKQIQLYEAALVSGVATLPELTKASKLQRSTVYLLAGELCDMGLLLEDHRTYKKLYIAAQPDTVFKKLEARHRQLGRINLAFKDALPELRALHQAPATRPRVRTFEGQNGLRQILHDILGQSGEVLLWTNQRAEKDFFHDQIHNFFIHERVKRAIPLRVLVVDNEEGRALPVTDGRLFRESRILPQSTHFTSETYIYGNKVAVIDFSKNVFGVITENPQIADSQRAIFELGWQLAGKTDV